jgi:hypothetical protein
MHVEIRCDRPVCLTIHEEQRRPADDLHTDVDALPLSATDSALLDISND